MSGLPDGGKETALVGTIVTLGNQLGLVTVAEGIESPHQRDALAMLGCWMAQGYLFAEPMSGDDVARLVERRASCPVPTRLTCPLRCGGQLCVEGAHGACRDQRMRVGAPRRMPVGVASGVA